MSEIEWKVGDEAYWYDHSRIVRVTKIEADLQGEPVIYVMAEGNEIALPGDMPERMLRPIDDSGAPGINSAESGTGLVGGAEE